MGGSKWVNMKYNITKLYKYITERINQLNYQKKTLFLLNRLKRD